MGVGRAAIVCAASSVAACDPGTGPRGAGASCQGDPNSPIGGAFTLVDTDGTAFSDQDLLGRYSLLYFGFTYCPDICPTELQKMTVALNGLQADGADMDQLQPVFISIDPERDSPAVMKKYLTQFQPAFIGLTGSLEAVDQAAKAYRIYYQKEPLGDDYTMGHSSFILAMDPDGHFMDVFTSDDAADTIGAALRPCL